MIEINNLFFSYTSAPPYLIENLNLKIEKGMYVSILGENGSAKSTLMKLILGLLSPVKGSISKLPVPIGYVPQKMENFNAQFPITVQEVLYCHLKALQLKDKTIIQESLKKVGMENYKDSLIGKLSGGQMQKIFIARALMGTPELLFLDEPSTGIDIQSQKEIYSLVYALNRKSKITVISIEHNLTAALKNSTHIFKLEKGNGKLYTLQEYKNYLEILENAENAEWVLNHNERTECIECARRLYIKNLRKLSKPQGGTRNAGI